MAKRRARAVLKKGNQMNYNKEMEEKKIQEADFGKVYWCPNLNKHVELSGIDACDGATFYVREFDVIDGDYVQALKYYMVEKTELFPIPEGTYSTRRCNEFFK